MNVSQKAANCLDSLLAASGLVFERRSDPRHATSRSALLSWRDGEFAARKPVRLIDISRSGAAVEVDGDCPSSSHVRICLGAQDPADWIDARVLGAQSIDGSKTVLRLAFHRRCLPSLIDLVVHGRRSHRANWHYTVGVCESLEGRQLLSAGAAHSQIEVAAEIGAVNTIHEHKVSTQVVHAAASRHHTASRLAHTSATTAGRHAVAGANHALDAAVKSSPARQSTHALSVGSQRVTPPPTALPASTDGASSASVPMLTLANLENDSFLAGVLYGTPGRMASGIAADGAVGVNATWESGQATTWYIEEQRYGADFVQAGLVTGDSALVQQGWNILNWGFAKEAADGSFPGTGDAFHSTSMFVEAAARALLLEVQANAPNAAQLVAEYLPRINASAQWLMTPSVAGPGDASDAPYTHRYYLLAAALGEVAALTQDSATTAAAETYALNGLALQTADGMNPELGGGDVSYQCYGILLAERYETVCPDVALKAQIQEMIVKGLQWDEGFISSSGVVSLADSTRTGIEPSRSGTTKTIDYKTMIQAFSLATTLTGDPTYRTVATEIASGLGWTKD